MKRATLIKKLPRSEGTHEIRAALYKVDPPMVNQPWYRGTPDKYYEFIVVSAADVPFSGPETYIFGADSEGNILDWGELGGSMRGTMKHGMSLSAAGYVIAHSKMGEVK
jgi:hypothetical protein